MNSPVSNFFWEINLYNIPVAIILGFSAGLIYGLVIFCSLGILLGLMGFSYFRNNEYYLYYNLGYSKKELVKKVFFRNLIIASFIFLIVIIAR